MKIDAFPHVMPRASYERFLEVASGPALGFLKGLAGLPALWDMDLRFRLMDAAPDCVQVVTMSLPPIEAIAPDDRGRDMARLANDCMAELVARHPDRFTGFAASLPMHDIEASLDEIERTIGHMGALGIQLFTNVNGQAPDDPRFAPVFARMAELDRPIWAHGWRSPAVADYGGENESKYGLWMALGWPYEMGMLMARLVFSGLLDRHPNLRILTHHSGGLTASFARRANGGALRFHMSGHEDERAAIASLKKRPLEYFKMFYADTTVGPQPHVIRASLDFFGPDHVLFGSDMPFLPESLPELMEAAEQAGLSPAESEKLFLTNARRVLGVKA